MLKFLKILACLAFLPSCSVVDPGNVAQPSTLKTARSAYLVVPEDAGRDMDQYLSAALATKGLKVTAGPVAAKPKQADIYVEYVDRWTWDVAMYLKSLDVSVHDNRTGQLIASGNFHQSFLHSFPSPRGKCQEVIDSIFEGSR